jgi:hypothetical protein
MNALTMDLNVHLAREFLPSTFEERGTTVPFTTPELLYSRVRRGRHRDLEVLVSGFSGGRGIYVFPWRVVPEIIRLNLHDQALHAEISHSDATTPNKMRIAAFRVARSGLGGVVLTEQAAQVLKDDATSQLTTNCTIMLRVIEMTGVKPRDADLATMILNSVEGKVLVRAAFRKLAGSLGVDFESCYARVGELSEIINPIGFDIDGQRGRLRRLYRRLRLFSETAIACDIGSAGRLLSDVARLTLEIGGRTFTECDHDISDMGGYILNWEVRVGSTRRSIERLSWLFDGWEHVLDLWDQAIADRGHIDHRLIAEILRIIPVIPRNECDPVHAHEVEAVNRRQSRIVQQFQDWRSGRFDEELIDRVEIARRKIKA